MVTITESAQEYLTELLEKQDCEGISVRIFILDAGTPKAETCISFCRPGEEKDDDEVKQYENFKTFIELASIPFLEEAVVDFAKDSVVGQLAGSAANFRLTMIVGDSTIGGWVKYMLCDDWFLYTASSLREWEWSVGPSYASQKYKHTDIEHGTTTHRFA